MDNTLLQNDAALLLGVLLVAAIATFAERHVDGKEKGGKQ